MPVVGAAIAVLPGGAAKFAHGEDHDVRHPITKIRVERRNRPGKIGEPPGQLTGRGALVGVGMPSRRISREGHFEADVGLDQLGNLHERAAEGFLGIVGAVGRLIFCRVHALQHRHGLEGFPARSMKHIADGIFVDALKSRRRSGADCDGVCPRLAAPTPKARRSGIESTSCSP